MRATLPDYSTVYIHILQQKYTVTLALTKML